jgi:hypothetical protein
MKALSTIFLSFCLSTSIAQVPQDTCITNGVCPAFVAPLSHYCDLFIGDTIGANRVIRMKTPTINTIIRALKLKTTSAELGWPAADAPGCFALYSTSSWSYPERQPLSILVYHKETGNLLVHSPLVQYDPTQKTIVFIDYPRDERLGVFDMISLKNTYFDALETACKSWWWCIKYVVVTEDDMMLEYSDINTVTRRKRYSLQH